MRSQRALGVALFLACSAGSSLLAEDPTDWTAADERWSVHLVTHDPDGRQRVTRIWLAMVDGTGVIRTGATQWWKNLSVDPECHLRVLGVDYPLRVEFTTEVEEIDRIDAAFLSKYGWQ